MRDLVEHLIKALVDRPQDIRLTEVDGEKTIVFELRCHPQDVGKVIGKNGKTITALRAVLSAVAARQNRRALFEVVE
jgi:predicted RNA-binding protein YlqC (UPF0109 family)